MKKIIPCLILSLLFTLYISSGTEAAVKDFRGVWVSTVYALDYPAAATTSPSALKSQADDILDQCQEMGMTAVILQVRPSADALYDSAIYPWSKYLTGKQGTAPASGFDPLTYWVTAAHNRGLELHAWINPYRVATSASDYNSLASSNPAKLHPEWVYEYNGKYYFDAGIPQVRQLIVDGVSEIVANYAVDGVHLDDYFYPGSGGTYDDATFSQYGKNFSNKDDWRRNNNDLLIQALYNVVKAQGRAFGVSPAGIWANKSSIDTGSATQGNQTYFSAYADTRKWVKEGWLDYICPQIYWAIGYKIADYQVLANWWADVVKNTGVDLYIGMADYRYGESGGAKWTDINIIKDQLALNATIPQITGEVHFRYGTLVDKPMLKSLYVQEYGSKGLPLLAGATAYHQSYIQGDGGKFRPDDSLSRAEFATIIARLLVDAEGQYLFGPKSSYPNSFSDVKAGAWYANAVGFMESQGVFYGYEDGTFRPEAKVSRAECAALFSRFFTVSGSPANTFSDVPANHWAREDIAKCAAKGYVEGYGDNTFRPNRSITRAEAVTLINRVLGRIPAAELLGGAPGFSDVPASHWAYAQILEASYSHQPH